MLRTRRHTAEVFKCGERQCPVFYGSNNAVGAYLPTTEPWDGGDYGPNRPWGLFDDVIAPMGSGGWYYETDNYSYIKVEGRGGVGYTAFGGALQESVGGNYNATNNNIRNNFLNFTIGATVGGSTSGYHEPLQNGYQATLAMNFAIYQLDPFKFATFDDITGFDCTEGSSISIPMPVSGATNCESIAKDNGSDTTYTTTWSFATGSTEVTLEGLRQRVGIDYIEDVTNHQIVFTDPVLSSAKIYVCYQVVS